MPPRSTWKGFLRLSLVSIPVKAYTASSSGGSEISLNQLHDKCHSRIRYQKVCPIHGEVTGDEIVMGYEYAKGQYVVVDPAELDKLRTESDKAINVDTFVPIGYIDPIYHSGKDYYLVPDGPAGQKGYALLHQAMVDDNLCCVGQVVLHGREQLVQVRPIEKLLCMTVLQFATQVKQPSSFEDELTSPDLTAKELELTKTLVEANLSDELDLSRYEDTYTAKLTMLIEKKVEGAELVAAPSEEPQHIINLMDALQASVAQAQAAAPGKEKKPAKKAASTKKMATSARQRKTETRKKKSG